MRLDIPRGSKGGDSSSPTQADDSLSSVTYAQIMDLISEGPIFGPPTGQPAQSVYLNNVPLMNADGSYNFNVNSFDFRYGEIDQTYIQGFDSSTSETSVGVELKQSTPWSVTVTDLTVDALIVTLGVTALSQTNSSNGDVTGYEVQYQIQLSVDGGAFQVVIDTAFSGKCTNPYQRSHRINLAGATSQYMVRVVRTSADTTSVYIQDTTSVVSYSQVVDAKLRYPLSALCALSIDAVQFSSVPTRSYDLKGLLIKYPSNYNPTTRAYTGTWDGTFTTGWTDNPAWIFYDLVLNARYGLGEWVDASMIDRYSLYTIAQYCDVMVSDGKGGQEPRFACNCYIQSRADAYKVLQDLASVFRGMAYWGAGSVAATSDMPSDPVYVYTAANVVGGLFKYVGSSLKTRYTCALVTWNDPDNAYQQAVEYVEDADGIARYGLNKAQITAFGCTSRGQAQRVGHWSLLTSRYETNAVTFSVGLDGTLAQPGQIIAIADAARAGRRMGGRLHAVADTEHVTLDKAMPEANVGDTLTVVMPSGVAAKSTVASISGADVTVSPAFASVPASGAVWMIESSTVQAQLFRVLSVTEKDGLEFEITATQHEPSKYAAIDDGAAMDVRPVTGNTFTTQTPPSAVTVSQYVVTDQGIAKTNMSISWQASDTAVSYSVQWQKDNGAWVDAGTTGGTTIDVSNVYSGTYVARVKATNGMGVSSVYAFSSATVIAGKTGLPPSVASLTATTDQVFAVNLAWTFPAGATDTAFAEVYYSHTSAFSDAVQLGQYSYPTNHTSMLGLASGYDVYFWIRLVDTTGNVGPWYPSQSAAGVHGASSSDATQVLSYLTGQITTSQLGQDVLGAIDSIVVPDMSGATTEYAGSTSVYAGLWTETSARQEADLALAQKTDGIAAQITTNNDTLLAAVQTETAARVAADSATATQITSLQSQVNSNTASVQTNAQSYASLNGQLSASYTIKTQVTAAGRTYIAGIGIGVNSSGGTAESTVLVSASQFSILDPNGPTVSSPFTVVGGQVYISQAMIGTGWITNAMIGQTIQSTAVGANGQPLWILDKANGITFNGPNGGSGYLNINSSTLTVYDNNGTLRVRLGLW